MTRRELGIYWLPVVAWMALIFTASTEVGSIRNTSRIIGPLLRWFRPDVSEEGIHNVQVAVRKAGHMSGYAILAILLFRARRRGIWSNAWDQRPARFAVIAAVLYAITDEFHQSFVPTREASALDVMIDTIGAIVGIAFVWVVGRIRCKW